MAEFQDLPVADCHVHVGGLAGIPQLTEIMDAAGLRSMSVLALSVSGDRSLSQNCIVLLFKALYPERIYAFGGLRHPLSGTVRDPLTYKEQAERLIRAGCDGMKMLEGKPTERKALQEPLDSPGYDAYYGFLEAEGIPLLYHVADPETFWDPEAKDSWRESPWQYGDGTYPSKEEIYAEMEHVLEKFPGLRIVFAHFYFLSADLDRAARFLDRWPDVNLDLTPGGEMYWNFSKHAEKARSFFTTYQDRILFGTDNCCGFEGYNTDKEMATGKIRGMRTFLEADGAFDWLGGQQTAIALDSAALSRIYAGNFHRFAGDAPKPVKLELALDECDRMIELARQTPEKERIVAELEEVKNRLSELRP